MAGNQPIKKLVQLWLEKIKLALDYKRRKFSKQAAENLKFYGGPHDFMYGDLAGYNEDDPNRPFRVTTNKAFEVVSVIGPHLFSRNPVRLVEPRVEDIPDLAGVADPAMIQNLLMEQHQRKQVQGIRANLMGRYLNYTPRELNLRLNSRKAIVEALVKGAGVLWTETARAPGGQFQLVGSFYDSVDNFVVDPDFEMISQAQWIARKCCHPVWQVERDYNLPAGTLKANACSSNRDAEIETGEYGASEKKEVTNDLFKYWKVYSKMGMGTRLVGGDKQLPDALRQVLDGFGDYVFLAIADNVDYPLNLPPQTWSQPPEQVQTLIQWPVPFYADGRWPVVPLWFHEIPNNIWPMGHLTPAMGEQKSLNWINSALVTKVRANMRDFIVVMKAAGEDIKKQIQNGGDLSIIELERAQGKIEEVVQFLQHPAFNKDILVVKQHLEQAFEQRTGLSEMMYGVSSVQQRSAAEAQNKMEMTKVRPDDMAEITEAWQTEAARNEALAARWILTGNDVAPIMGGGMGMLWDMHVRSAKLEEVARELDYTIEAGSAAKPNLARKSGNVREAMQFLLQPLLGLAQANPANWQTVNNFLADFAESQGLRRDAYVVQPPLPPPMPGVPPQGQPGQEEPQGPGAQAPPQPPLPPPVDPMAMMMGMIPGGAM